MSWLPPGSGEQPNWAAEVHSIFDPPGQQHEQQQQQQPQQPQPPGQYDANELHSPNAYAQQSWLGAPTYFAPAASSGPSSHAMSASLPEVQPPFHYEAAQPLPIVTGQYQQTFLGEPRAPHSAHPLMASTSSGLPAAYPPPQPQTARSLPPAAPLAPPPIQGHFTDPFGMGVPGGIPSALVEQLASEMHPRSGAWDTPPDAFLAQRRRSSIDVGMLQSHAMASSLSQPQFLPYAFSEAQRAYENVSPSSMSAESARPPTSSSESARPATSSSRPATASSMMSAFTTPPRTAAGPRRRSSTTASVITKRQPRPAATDVVCPHEGCGKVFPKNRVYNLKAHLRSHTNSKPFTCPEAGCGRSFSRKHDLQRHVRVHTGDKPYQCDACGRGFPRSDALKRHWKAEPTCLEAVGEEASRSLEGGDSRSGQSAGEDTGDERQQSSGAAAFEDPGPASAPPPWAGLTAPPISGLSQSQSQSPSGASGGIAMQRSASGSSSSAKPSPRRGKPLPPPQSYQ